MTKTKDGKKFLTVDEAVNLLPEGDTIHTFYSTGICIFGADWDRKDVLKKLTVADYIEIAGEQAKAMSHGLAAYNEGVKLSDVLFIETDEEKLNAFDPLEIEDNKF